MARCACGYEHGVVDGECADCTTRRKYAEIGPGPIVGRLSTGPWASWLVTHMANVDGTLRVSSPASYEVRCADDPSMKVYECESMEAARALCSRLNDEEKPPPPPEPKRSLRERLALRVAPWLEPDEW